MAFEQNILFSDMVEKTLIEESKLVAIANKEFEGTIEFKGSVKVKFYGAGGTISDYNETDGFGNLEFLDGNTITLNIDKAKGFMIAVKDVTASKTGNDLSIWADQTIKNLRYVVEQDVYALNDTIVAGNKITSYSATKATVSNVIEMIEELRIKMGENNVRCQKFLTVSPRIASLLRQKNLLSLAQVTLNTKMGPVSVDKYGEDITIIETNLVPGAIDAEGKLFMGSMDLLNLAVGLNKVIFFVPEKHVSEAVKGLLVYGCKIFNGTKGATLTYLN